MGHVAYAQDGSRGESLYEAGVQAYAQGDLATACPSFKQSFEADAQSAPLFMLAKCEERQGRIASALDHFEQVIQRGGLDPELTSQAANAVVALSPRVPRVTITRGAAPASAVAKVDGVIFTVDARPIPIDPGAHELLVVSPAHAPRTETFTIKESESLTVEMKVGAPLAVDAPPPRVPRNSPPAEGSDGLWIAGWTVGGIGLAAFAVAGVTGGLILDACEGSIGCEGRTPDDPGDGLLVANGVGWGVGIAGVATGATLLIIAAVADSEVESDGQSQNVDAPALSLVSGPGDAGAGLVVSF
jgi:hypothetical protein